MDLNLEDIFINLRLISKIEIGDKLVFTKSSLLSKLGLASEQEVPTKYINIDNSYIPSISRWMKNVDRNKSVQFIGHIMNEAFKHNDTTLDIQLILRLTSEFRSAISGLTNLKQTYSDDKLIQSEIDVIIENIRSKIDSNSTKLKLSK